MTLLAILAVAATANIWENPAVNSIDRLPARTYSVPLSSVKEALSDVPGSIHASEMTLNGNWRFFWTGNPSLAPKDFFKPGFDDSKWDEIDVPSCVEMRGWGIPVYTNVRFPVLDTTNPSLPNFGMILDKYAKTGDYNPVSSYRRTFKVPEAWNGKKVILRFEGVGSAFYVWINGKMAGYAEDSKLASEFDITSFVKQGEENIIAVKVYKWCDGSFLEDQDMFRYSGIFRDVSLWACPKDGIWDFLVKTSLSSNFTKGHISVEGVDGAWKWTLYDAAGKNVASFDSAKDQRGVMKTISDVKLWSADKPNLYTLVIEKGGDIRAKKIGFKEQKIVGDVFYVNGNAVKFYGVNRHETSPENGRTVTIDEMKRDIVLMKRYNIDTVRTSHYPNHRVWYDLCDLYGIYVVAEANVEGHEPGYGKRGLGNFREWDHTIIERNERNVLQYRNNPSVTMWSLGNETGHGESFRKAYARVKELDPLSRPVHWERGNKDADVDSVMYPSMNWLIERIGIFSEDPAVSDKKKRKHPSLKASGHSPGKPFFMCEYAHAMGNAIGNLQEYWDLVYSHPGMMGGCIWDWIDQAIWVTTDEIDPKTGLAKRYLAYGGDHDETPNDGPFCCNGVIGPDRKVTPKLIEVAHVYRGFDIVKDKKGAFKIINRRAFVSPDEFDCRWECFVDGKKVKEGDVDLPKVKPLGEAPFKFDFAKKVELEKSVLASSEVVLRFNILTRKPSLYAPKGWTVACCEIPMTKPVTRTYPAAAELIVISDDEKTLTVGCGRTTAVFSRATGTLTRLVMRGIQVLADPAPGIAAGPRFSVSRAFVDNDKNIRSKFYESGLTQLKYTPAKFEIVSNTVKTVTRITGGKSGGFVHEAVWRFAGDGSLVVENKVKPFGTIPDLPRAGLSMRLSPGLEKMRYYGRGPWENYVDRCTGSMLGIWESTVTDQYVDYVRPQDNGYKSFVRWAEFLDKSGAGVRFDADVPLFMQALHCTEDSLEWARHRNGETRRLRPVVFHDDIFLRLDVRQRGLGGGSCGPATIPQYVIDKDSDIVWTMRISPVVRAAAGK